jgi:hypothetical protein
MRDCSRSRKEFGLDERHGINDTTTIREGFFRASFRMEGPLSVPALWSVLARGFLSRQVALEARDVADGDKSPIFL